MREIKTALDLAVQAADTLMATYRAEELPPVPRFHYHQGVFLSGMYKTYELTADEKYPRYIKDWLKSVITEDGGFRFREETLVDDMQPAILLFPFLAERPEDDEEPRFRQALENIIAEIPRMKRNALGGFWHKTHLPNEMWLDGLYMLGPLMSEYAARFGRPDLFEETARQVRLMVQGTKDPATGLLYHAFDPERRAAWAGAEGHSPEFWGRSLGWVPVAILDDLDFFPAEHPARPWLEETARGLLAAICRFQSAEGRWYQVLDKGGREDNWLENSCSCLFAAALAKAVRKGLLPAEYKENAERAFVGVKQSLTWEEDKLLLGGVCIGTGVGDYKYYVERPCSVNDLHGMGALLLMCTELARLRGEAA